MESRKMVLMNLVENGLVDTAGEGEGVMNWENSIDINNKEPSRYPISLGHHRVPSWVPVI